jgi:hypothetical protein
MGGSAWRDSAAASRKAASAASAKAAPARDVKWRLDMGKL